MEGFETPGGIPREAGQGQVAAPPPPLAYPGTGFPGQAYPGQAYPGQVYPGQAYPGQAYAGQANPGQAYPGSPYPGPAFPGARLPGTIADPGTGALRYELRPLSTGEILDRSFSLYRRSFWLYVGLSATAAAVTTAWNLRAADLGLCRPQHTCGRRYGRGHAHACDRVDFDPDHRGDLCDGIQRHPGGDGFGGERGLPGTCDLGRNSPSKRCVGTGIAISGSCFGRCGARCGRRWPCWCRPSR